MIPTEVKLARIEAKKALSLAYSETFRQVICNPIVELVSGFVAVELLQRYPKDRPVLGELQGTLMEGAIGGIITVQQISPALPYLVKGTGDIMGALTSLAPLLATAGL